MRYDDEALQDLLAAEYALGNLRGAARRRLATLMRQRPTFRQRVLRWENEFYALDAQAPAVAPPARVWRAIEARVSARRGRSQTAGWWRWIAAGGAAAALAVALLLGVLPTNPPATMVAVLNDAQAQPSILVWWPADAAKRSRLKLRILVHPQMPPDTSWQAWLLRDGSAAALPLGLIGTETEQVLELSAETSRALAGATGIGVSVEPKGGSPSGRPNAPFLFQGPALRVDS